MTEPTVSDLRAADEAGDAVAARELGRLLAAEGNIAEAQAAFGRAEARGDVQAVVELASLLKNHGDDDGAVAAYRRADAAGSLDGAGNLGRMLRERGDRQGAEEAFRRCAERGSVRALGDYVGLMLERGDASADEIEEATVSMCRVEDEAVTTDFEGFGALGTLTAFAAMFERCDPVVMEAGVQRAHDEGSASGAFHLGILLRARGRLRESAEASLRAGERGYKPAWTNAAVALWEAGDQETALSVARHGEKLGDESASNLVRLMLGQRD